MRFLAPTALLLACSPCSRADDTVSKGRIKVQLFAAPSFVSEVSVDVYNKVCLSLGNNLIDGQIQSILVGGHDVDTVLGRSDWWTCRFYNNYECKDEQGAYLVVPDGVNNLESVSWGGKIHSINCRNYDPNL